MASADRRSAAGGGHRARPQANRIALLAGADAETASRRAANAPLWLAERIDLCLAARRAIGEQVTEAENARDQLTAYTVHVTRHRSDLDGPWTGTPDDDLDTYVADLHRVIGLLAGGV